MKTITYIELGGTLFIPASHPSLYAIVNEQKYQDLKSLVIDFEDGLDNKLFVNAMEMLDKTLADISTLSPAIFLRARCVEHLEELLSITNIQNIQGFVLAKFSLLNAKKYLYLMKNSDFVFMPSIEGKELFNTQKLQELKELLLPHKQKIVLVRFGLEDMLRQLGMRRECGESLFDLSAPSSVIGNFIAIFKSSGFMVSGGVYPCFKDKEGFIRDVKRDLKEGLFSKTIIHPKQISLLNECYRVSKKEYEEAREIVKSQMHIFTQSGKMAEVVTMLPHSQAIVLRAELYGIKKN
jgi:citrate lyase beta subunit